MAVSGQESGQHRGPCLGVAWFELCHHPGCSFVLRHTTTGKAGVLSKKDTAASLAPTRMLGQRKDGSGSEWQHVHT